MVSLGNDLLFLLFVVFGRINIPVSIGRISKALGVKKMRDHRGGLETLRRKKRVAKIYRR